MFVYDAGTGKPLAPPLPLAQFGLSSWTDDGRKLFVTLLANQPAGAPLTAKYLNSRLMIWDLKSDPVALFGGSTKSRIEIAPEKIPFLTSRVGAAVSVAAIANGTENELELWTVPAASAANPDAPWTRLITPDNGVTNVDLAGDRVYLLSHKGAPTFQILTVHAGAPMSASTVLVAGRADRLIEGMGTAKDGLYVRARHGLYSELIRIPLNGGPEKILPLPFKGSITEMFTDPTRNGATIELESWAIPPTVLTYDPANSTFTRENLGKKTPRDSIPGYFISRISRHVRRMARKCGYTT